MTENSQVDLLVEVFGEGKTVAEIGCYLGNTTKELAKKNKVIAIDPFLGGYDERDSVSRMLSGENSIKTTFLENTKGLDVTFMEMKGHEAYEKYEGEIDGFFLDSEHTFEGVKRDSIWINKVKENGILAFHDYTNTFPGVKQFIDEEIIPKYELIKQLGTLIIFKNKRINNEGIHKG